jgi:3-oxoacyl-[acyl-carrier-protein] synthase III
MLMPSSACFVQKELGATNAFAYDLNAACSGFLYGLDLADKYIRADHNHEGPDNRRRNTVEQAELAG